MRSQESAGPPGPLQPNLATRASLLRRVRNLRDDGSWQEFFEIYWHLIYGLAVKAGLSENEAEEIVQDTMIGLAKNLPAFRYDPQVGSFRNWLITQVKWKIADHVRQRQRADAPLFKKQNHPTQTRTATVDQIPDGRDALTALADLEWDEVILQTALQRIKERVKARHFQMFDLCAIKKWPMARVARVLGVNVAQVYLAKSRISRLLKVEIKRVEAGLERPPASLGKVSGGC